MTTPPEKVRNTKYSAYLYYVCMLHMLRPSNLNACTVGRCAFYGHKSRSKLYSGYVSSSQRRRNPKY